MLTQVSAMSRAALNGDPEEETVQGQEHILRERITQLACVDCDAHHHPDDMLVLAQRGSRWLLLLTCWQCQRRGIFVASFPHSEAAKHLLDSQEASSPTQISPAISHQWLIPSTAPLTDAIPGIVHPGASSQREDVPVTSGDVESIRHFLEGFNGDFRTLFGPSGGMARG